MKQNITKEQWEELDKINEGAKSLWCLQIHPFKCETADSSIYSETIDECEYLLPNIGEIIEFLGSELDSMILSTRWTVTLDIDSSFKQFTEKELVDTLWEACHYKLKQKEYEI